MWSRLWAQVRFGVGAVPALVLLAPDGSTIVGDARRMQDVWATTMDAPYTMDPHYNDIVRHTPRFMAVRDPPVTCPRKLLSILVL